MPAKAYRRVVFHQLLAADDTQGGYATDTGAGLHYQHDTLVAAIADRSHADAYHVTRSMDGGVQEEPLEVIR